MEEKKRKQEEKEHHAVEVKSMMEEREANRINNVKEKR